MLVVEGSEHVSNTNLITCLVDSLREEKTVSTNFLIPKATEHDTETAVTYDSKKKLARANLVVVITYLKFALLT